MITKTKHTPTPWVSYLSTVYKPERDDLDSSLDAIDAEKIVCSVINQADAAFIVRAVNAHEKLVNALKSIEEYWNGGKESAVDAAEEMRERAREAIAKAEAQS